MTGYSPSGLVAPAQRHAGFSGSCGLERAAVVAPAEWPGLVVVGADELQDLPGEVGAGGELAAAQQPALDGKKISAMLSQEACTGVRVTWKRGRAASHARVAREVWDDPLSMTR